MLEKKQEGKLDTLIGKNTRLTGEVRTEASIRLDGKLEGNITVADMLITGQESHIKGDVRCKNAIIGGRIEGNIFSSNLVEMQSGSSLLGDIVCKGLVIQESVFFEGHCRMSEKKKE